MESNIQKKILRYLKDIGAYAVKTMVSSRNGTPDILCCFNGRFYAFEVKDILGKATELQGYNIRLIQKAGGRASVVRCVNDVKQILMEG